MAGGGVRGGWRVLRIGASGFRRSRLLRKRMLRLASRGLGNRQIAFTPCRRGVRASSRRPLPFLPETGRTSTRFVALSLPARSSRSPAHGRDPSTAPGLRLRGGCGAMLSSRAAPPSHPPRHASAGGVRAPSRSSRTVRSTAPRSAHIQSQDICAEKLRRGKVGRTLRVSRCGSPGRLAPPIGLPAQRAG